MSLATAKAALLAWVQAQTGLPAQWQNAAQTWDSKARARLNITTALAQGQDLLHFDHDPTVAVAEGFTGGLVPTITGCRQITLTVEITTRDQTGNNEAVAHLERLRLSLRKPRTRQALIDAGLGFATAGSVVELDTARAGRVESIAALEFLFNATEQETDSTEALGYAERFGVDNQIGTAGESWLP